MTKDKLLKKKPRHLVDVEIKNFFLGGGGYENHMRMSFNLDVPDSLLSVSPPLSIAGVIFTPIRDKSVASIWSPRGLPQAKKNGQ